MTRRRKLEKRSKLYHEIRSFFTGRGYLEVETPLVVPCPGAEVHLEYFSTEWKDHYANLHPGWLRSSPELHIKKLLAEPDIDRVFELAKCFRNGGEYSPWHHPEFMMLEWYQKAQPFRGMIEETIALLEHTALAMDSVWAKEKKDFTWLTLEEAFQELVGLTLVDQDPELGAKAKAQGVYSIQPGDDFETSFFKVLLEKIEPEFQRMERVVLYDYPPSQAALAKVEGKVAKRFELYVSGVELCNGFYELTDEGENRKRFADIAAQRALLGKPPLGLDEAFFAALGRGLPDCSGNALGVDRWLALLLGEKSLDAVLPFQRNGYLASWGTSCVVSPNPSLL